jgi:hypothetical protein
LKSRRARLRDALNVGFRYDALPVFDAFERVSDPAIYTPLPSDWHIGVADVVNSTEALAAGRYKAVNMAGAAVVGSIKNAAGMETFPFVFGGDGAIFAVPSHAEGLARDALAATATFAREELDLILRVGIVSVAAIRAAGQDMRVARYAASSEAVYAMFSGGGARFAEAELKAGRIAIEPAPAGARPDLTGLSCRFAPFTSRRGVILSLIVTPAEGGDTELYRKVANDVISMLEAEERAGHPLPPEGPPFSFRPSYFRYEIAATRRSFAQACLAMGRVAFEHLVANVLSRTGGTVGRLNVRHYQRWVARNSDFRKFDDGLRMTVDCTPKTADELAARLDKAEKDRIIDYGLHRQESALITCLVPSVLQDDHLHFLDGAGGGYALAAEGLKARLAARQDEPAQQAS